VRSLNVAGEGGEYETAVLDAPFFSERIEPESVERVVTGTTSQLRFERARLVSKGETSGRGASA
jgi:diphthine-ammonia ligase